MLQPPVVLRLAGREAIHGLVHVVQLAERAGEALERGGRRGPRLGHPRQHVGRERPVAEQLARAVGQRLVEILGVVGRAADAVALDHAPIGQVAAPLALAEVGGGCLEIGRHGVEPRHHEPPLVLAAEQLRRGRGHLLELPIHAAEGLRDVRVHAPLVIAAVVDLVQQESELRLEHARVDPFAGVEGGPIHLAECVPDLPVEGDLPGQCLRAIVPEAAVGSGEGRAVAVAAQIGRDHRVELQGADEVAVAERREGGGTASLGGGTAGAYLAQNAERGGSPDRSVDELTAVHGGSVGAGKRKIGGPLPTTHAAGYNSASHDGT